MIKRLLLYELPDSIICFEIEGKIYLSYMWNLAKEWPIYFETLLNVPRNDLAHYIDTCKNKVESHEKIKNKKMQDLIQYNKNYLKYNYFKRKGIPKNLWEFEVMEFEKKWRILQNECP